ncbi:hypothetical protein [Leclercia sp. Marseille-Q4284]|uniref:hypothetical protein n=1 Tax=Leclercia sp. Marseille-Q4284 TaxID=2866582 RepID=UPI001CE3CEAE|nr:hypothetical protein [Leclercia sp. Marseille-Q4284]
MRTHIIQTNFTAGEVSPRLLGRVDIQRYGNACKTAENVNVVIQGGLRRRDGLQFVYPAKDVGNGADGNPKPIRLIPWVFSREESYVLELGDGYIRFYQNGRILLSDPNNPNSAPYEVPGNDIKTLTADLLQDLSYAQGADTMYFAHIKHAPMRLVRHGQLNWTFETINWSDAANTMPFGEDPARLSPDCWLAPSAQANGKLLVGSIIDLKLQQSDIATTAPTNGAAFTAADVGKYIRVNGGVVKIKTVADAANATGEITSLMYGDAGSSNLVASPNSWTLEEGVWSDAKGWPGCVAFHQQRLIFAGSKLYPQTIWGSAIRQYLNFELGYVDDAAYSFTLDSDQVNPITHLFSLNSLVALTHSSEFIISGTNNTISPTSISVRVPSNYGASYVRPMRVGTELVYIQRAGRKILSMSYDPDSQTAYSVSDLSVLAEHMTEDLVIDSAYQQEPESFVRLVTGGGELITLTYNKENEVTGWTRSRTGVFTWQTTRPDPNDKTKTVPVDNERHDHFMNVASIPTLSGVDDCYAAVRRNVGGKMKLYIERFREGLNVDSALIGAPDPANATAVANGLKEWTALDHLEGETVHIVADGVPMPPQKVTGGKITLSRPAFLVNIGLPFFSKIVTLKPEFQTPAGTPQGAHNSTSKVRIRLLDTVGMTINGDAVPFRNFGKYILNQPAPLFTGDMEWQLIGWDNQEITIEQRQPLPFHMLAVIRTINVN